MSGRRVVVIGRPNVGKSTLFNRLTGRNRAIVHAQAGATRDWQEAPGHLRDLSFQVVDTPGFDDSGDPLADKMRRLTQAAIASGDLILFMVDGRQGITPRDEYYAGQLRKAKVPVIVLVNKCETEAAQHTLYEAASLGMHAEVALSAQNGLGLLDLHDAMVRLVPGLSIEESTPEDTTAIAPLRMAIVGRPNVGKSTLINTLLGEERLLTADQAGITRDAVAITWSYKDQPITLIDTAGIRKRSRRIDDLEDISVSQAFQNINFAQIVVHIIDAQNALNKQDLLIANRVIDEGRVLILALNKWDLVKNQQAYLKEIYQRLEHTLSQARGIVCVPISAINNSNVKVLLDQALKLYDVWNKRVSTGALNRWLDETTQYHPPPLAGRNRIRLKYMTQVAARPPTFALFVSKAQDLPTSYVRFLQNSLRDTFDLPGVPIRLHLRTGKNPYHDKKG